MTRYFSATLLLCAATHPLCGADPDLRAAVERGLARVQTAAGRYIENRSCFSCHHQLVVPVLAEAKARGFRVDPWVLWSQTEFTRETFRSKLDRIVQGQAIPGANTMAAYALFVLEAGGQEPDETTDGLLQFLTVRQDRDGSWPALADRPPSEGSKFTNAALALRALTVYGLQNDALTADMRIKVRASWKAGREWVAKQTPTTTEDKAFHLRAMVEGKLPAEGMKLAQAALIAEQREDGGWAQLPELKSDAYATGIVLTALHRSGMAATDAAYRKGAEYLLKSQRPDGGWVVTTRSKPVQTFFDNGDPGGKSQFISTAATNWAMLALLNAIERKP
jgi:N-acyl-D-amino-acid deacylase